jgi:hypothetical protein
MLFGLVIAAEAAAAGPADLSAFAPFAGSCWVADFTPAVSDTHCFETMYGGAHVRDRHEVKDKGKVVYAGETIYSLDGGQRVFTYFNSLGGVGRGTVDPSGAILHFKGSMRGSPEKAPQQIDSEWRLVDQDHYDVRSLVKSASTAGNGVVHFTRVK